MALQALLLTRDPEVLRVMRRVLSESKIQVETMEDAGEAMESLARRKHDAVVLDCDHVHGAIEVLKSLRKAPSNRSAIAFAITNRKTSQTEAFAMGANFVLEKPLSMDRVARSIKAAHGLILRERRRYERRRIDVGVSLIVPGSEQISAAVANLSEGGMAVKLIRPAPVTGTVRVRFQLPDSSNTIEAKSEIAWCDPEGKRIGVRFLEMSPQAHREMDRWLEKEADVTEHAQLFLEAARGARATN